MQKLTIQRQCKKYNLEQMHEAIKYQTRQNPWYILKWQEYFAPEEAVIEKTHPREKSRNYYNSWYNPAGIKEIGDQYAANIRKTRWKLRWLNDQDYFRIREYIDLVIDDADTSANPSPYINRQS